MQSLILWHLFACPLKDVLWRLDEEEQEREARQCSNEWNCVSFTITGSHLLILPVSLGEKKNIKTVFLRITI